MKNRFKRIVASLLAALMVFAFMPAMAFAKDEPTPPPKSQEIQNYEAAVDAVAKFFKRNPIVRGFLLEYYDEISEVVESVGSFLSYVDLPEKPEKPEGKPEGKPGEPPTAEDLVEKNYDELLKVLDEYLDMANEYMHSFKYEESKDASIAFRDEVVALKELIAAKAEPALIDEQAEKVTAAGEKLLDAVFLEVIDEALDKAIKDASDWLENTEGIDPNVAGILSSLLATGEEVRTAIMGYEEAAKYYAKKCEEHDTPGENADEVQAILDELQAKVEEAKEAFGKAVEDAREYAMEVLLEEAGAAMDFVTGDALNEELENLGLPADDIKAFILDATQYVFAYAVSGGEISYQNLEKEISDLDDEIYGEDGYLDQIEALENQTEVLEGKLEEAQAAEKKDAQDIAALQNALKVTNTKVTIKKPKSKKKKVTAKWAPAAGVTISGYQVQWKVGKKTYKKFAAASATSLKSKKLKKGKKAEVQVRAYVTYNGVNYFGQWSKAKTVKVK
jgi:hypothetical protein